MPYIMYFCCVVMIQRYIDSASNDSNTERKDIFLHTYHLERIVQEGVLDLLLMYNIQ